MIAPKARPFYKKKKKYFNMKNGLTFWNSRFEKWWMKFRPSGMRDSISSSSTSLPLWGDALTTPMTTKTTRKRIDNNFNLKSILNFLSLFHLLQLFFINNKKCIAVPFLLFKNEFVEKCCFLSTRKLWRTQHTWKWKEKNLGHKFREDSANTYLSI